MPRTRGRAASRRGRRWLVLSLGLVVLAGCASSTAAEDSGAGRSNPLAAPETVAPAPATTTVPVPPPERVLLIGDSIAESLGSASLPTYARVGCGITDGVPVNTISPTISAQCAADRDAWLGAAPDADAYLVLSSWEINDFSVDGRRLDFLTPQWDAWMTGQYEAILARLPGRLFLVTNAPRGPVDGKATMSELFTATYQLNDWYARFAASHPNVGLIDLASMVCPSRTCPEYVDGIRIRPDGGHYSPEGAAWLAPRLRTALDKEWARLSAKR